MSTPSRIARFAVAAALVPAALWVAGCRSQPESTATAPGTTGAAPAKPAASGRIVLLSNNTSPFWVAVEHGMDDAARQLGANAELVRNNVGTVAGQIQRLDELSAQADVKGIALSVLDAGAQGVTDKMKALQAKGVNVVTIDSDGSKDARYAYIGANNEAAGEQAGRAAAELLPAGGKVVAFVGTKAAANARERLQGFTKGAGPKFTVVDVMEDGADTTKARANVTAAIQTHPDAKLLLGLWSYNAPAIAEEVERANKRSSYKIVTFDAEPNTILALQKGLIDATVVQQPYEYGFQAVKLLKALADKDQATLSRMVPPTKIVDVPCRTVAVDPKGPVRGSNVITFDTLKTYLKDKGLKGT